MFLSTLKIHFKAGKPRPHNLPRGVGELTQRLRFSEGALVAATCGEGTVRLQNNFAAQFAALGELGQVLSLTRNRHVVLERVGCYGPFDHFGQASQIVGEQIELRLFLDKFHTGFSVVDAGPYGERRSIQYFDEYGASVHKVHLRPESSAAGWLAFRKRFGADDQNPEQQFAAAPALAPLRPDSEIDREGFRRAYQQMRDSYELFGLLRRFGTSRLQALRMLSPDLARPVDTLSLRTLLGEAAEAALPIQLLVGNQAAVQSISGPVRTLRQHGDWLNVLDPGVSLHLFEPGIASAWVVQKPTLDGMVSSLELYGENDKSLLLAYSKRKPGQPEPAPWREILGSLPTLGVIP